MFYCFVPAPGLAPINLRRPANNLFSPLGSSVVELVAGDSVSSFSSGDAAVASVLGVSCSFSVVDVSLPGLRFAIKGFTRRT